MNKARTTLPGALAVNVALMVFGVILTACALILGGAENSVSPLLAGIGGGAFVAGFVGLLNTSILATEIHKVSSQPLDDACLLAEVRVSGLDAIRRDRAYALPELMQSMETERKEIVVVGSSLKGFIGVGYTAVGQEEQMRNVLVRALKNGVQLNILMTSPKIAHHRSQQEGRQHGDIEAEIIENLMYLVKLWHDDPSLAGKLQIKLYDGTPTIFLACTSELMLLNPYPYYSTALNSFALLLEGRSELYRGYYASHYQRAWTDTQLSELIKEQHDDVLDQIRSYIVGKNEHGDHIIPDKKKQTDLQNKLAMISQT